MDGEDSMEGEGGGRGDCWVTRENPDVPKGASWRDRLLSGKLGRRLEPFTLDHFPSLRHCLLAPATRKTLECR